MINRCRNRKNLGVIRARLQGDRTLPDCWQETRLERSHMKGEGLERNLAGTDIKPEPIEAGLRQDDRGRVRRFAELPQSRLDIPSPVAHLKIGAKPLELARAAERGCA